MVHAQSHNYGNSLFVLKHYYIRNWEKITQKFLTYSQADQLRA